MVDFYNLPEHLIDRANILGLERLRGYRFAVQIGTGAVGDNLLGGFTAVEGLSDSVRVREVKEGGAAIIRRFPRVNQPRAITLRRGMSTSHMLWQWYQEVVNWEPGNEDYRLPTLSIYMIDHVFIRKLHVNIPYEVWRFTLSWAWPSQWIGPSLNADVNGHAFEGLTIEHSGMSVGEGIFTGQVGDLLSLLHQ
jgi:phage tail-like protein